MVLYKQPRIRETKKQKNNSNNEINRVEETIKFMRELGNAPQEQITQYS